jgi:hypothetical protein
MRARTAAELKKQAAQYKPTFPLWAAGVAAAAALLYHQIGQMVVLGPVVPLINGVFVAVLVIVTLRTMINKS